ncbi:MAG: bifunctional ADP-dependent NAD(P)H-hydrate dehydratase/NAD(P)H-hydrate epimerase [Bacteroidetes bacterium]|nr:MAG: bifunctional ADP-dependent NAD(P)H-hydrate dehydratase/NAD(P)H-hydrate epimerase [Bacteroidota bacterium]
MKILSAKQVKAVDAYTIAEEPIASIDLMERASIACFKWLIERYAKNRPFIIFCGLGNNGGDGLAITRLLSEKGYYVEAHIIEYSENQSKDFQTNLARLKRLKSVSIVYNNEKRMWDGILIPKESVIIDAIFGSGISRPIDGFTREIIDTINHCTVDVVAIDIPSGMFVEGNDSKYFKGMVHANWTLSLQLPKLAFMFSDNTAIVGNWVLIPIGLHEAGITAQKSSYHFITGEDAKSLLRVRNKFDHKGKLGHTLMIAGSKGMMGAAMLATKACLRAGAGLVTALVPSIGYGIMQTAVPESMALADSDKDCITKIPALDKYASIAIGPGIGDDQKTERALKHLIQNTRVPLVLDADAINIISRNKTWISFVPQNSIYTPHPGEFTRLIDWNETGYDLLKAQVDFSKKHGVYVVLKGMHTSISCPDGTCYFNSTGNPGMATGGSGDVLTGVIAGLMSQQYDSRDACILGVYLHGLSGDISAEQRGQESIIASDIIENLGKAFQEISN